MLKRFSFLLLCCLSAVFAVAQDARQEADLKAAFIYNFTKYVDWDSTNADHDFIIGIIGRSPLVSPLTEIAKTNAVNDKKIVVKIYNKPEEIGSCNILFIPKNTRFSLQSILDRCGRGVLTVSEEQGYAKKGTAFNFIIMNDKLKFEVNLRALYLAGLKAGSQLLKLAVIVE